jgi:hypothetical protein
LILKPEINICIIGDFNQMNTINLEAQCALTPLVCDATRKNNILDQILVPESSKTIMNVEILSPIGGSDHNTLIMCPKTITSPSTYSEHCVHDLRRNNIDAFINCLNSFNFNAIYNCDDINTAVELYNKVCTAALSVIPVRMVKIFENDKKWMTPKLKLLINDKWSAYRQKKFDKFNTLKAKVKVHIEKAKQNWINKNSDNAKSFWSVVNDLTNRKKNSNSLGSLINAYHDISTLANIINDKFCASYIKSKELPQIIDSQPVQTVFSEHEVFLKLIHLNTNKAAPRGALSAVLMKNAACILTKPLCHLLNLSVQSNVVPKVWKRPDVIPKPKTEPVNLDDLRPISIFHKEMIILEQLVLLANKKTILNNIDQQQYGFKPLSSSTCALIDIDNYIRKQLDLKSTKAVCW